MFKKSFLSASVALIGVFAVNALPAHAQFFVNPYGDNRAAGNFHMVANNIAVGLSNVTNQINAGISSGQLSPSEASFLQSRVNDLQNQNAHMAADGVYSTSEVTNYLAQLDALNREVTGRINDSVTARNFGYGGYGGFYGDGYNFQDYNSVLNFQNQLRNMIYGARVAPNYRNAWLNEYNSLQRRLTRQAFNRNFRNNNDLKQMVKLQQKIRKQQMAGKGIWR